MVPRLCGTAAGSASAACEDCAWSSCACAEGRVEGDAAVQSFAAGTARNTTHMGTVLRCRVCHFAACIPPAPASLVSTSVNRAAPSLQGCNIQTGGNEVSQHQVSQQAQRAVAVHSTAAPYRPGMLVVLSATSRGFRAGHQLPQLCPSLCRFQQLIETKISFRDSGGQIAAPICCTAHKFFRQMCGAILGHCPPAMSVEYCR